MIGRRHFGNHVEARFATGLLIQQAAVRAEGTHRDLRTRPALEMRVTLRLLAGGIGQEGETIAGTLAGTQTVRVASLPPSNPSLTSLAHPRSLQSCVLFTRASEICGMVGSCRAKSKWEIEAACARCQQAL